MDDTRTAIMASYLIRGRHLDVIRAARRNRPDPIFDVVDHDTEFHLTDSGLEKEPDKRQTRQLLTELISDYNNDKLTPPSRQDGAFAFLRHLDGYITLSMRIDNSYELYPDITTFIRDRVLPAPPTHSIDYHILALTEPDIIVATGQADIFVADHETAALVAEDRVRETDPRIGDWNNPTVRIISVDPITSDKDAIDGAWAGWVDHIYVFTGAGNLRGDSWYDVTITASSDPRLVGRKFAFGY